jgi:hypothetical protein
LGKGATRADFLGKKREGETLMWAARSRAIILRPLDLYPMAPGLRGIINFAPEGMPIATTMPCSPRKGAASALGSRRCEEHQSGHLSRIAGHVHRLLAIASVYSGVGR